MEALNTVFTNLVGEVVEFITGLLPVFVPLLILAIGIPLGIKLVKRFSNIKAG